MERTEATEEICSVTLSQVCWILVIVPQFGITQISKTDSQCACDTGELLWCVVVCHGDGLAMQWQITDKAQFLYRLFKLSWPLFFHERIHCFSWVTCNCGKGLMQKSILQSHHDERNGISNHWCLVYSTVYSGADQRKIKTPRHFSNKISLKYVPWCLIDNMSALVQIMAWRHPGDKPLSEPMLIQFTIVYMQHYGKISSWSFTPNG